MSSLAAKMVVSKPKTYVPMGKRWYVYGHTEIDEQGNKKPLIPIRKSISNWRSRSHVQTVMTAADGSNLLYGFALDLDFKDAEDRWKNRGKLDAKKMRAFLAEAYPTLSRFLCTWTRSTGGRGLGVILFFDPFLLRHEKTGGVTFLAERVQRLTIKLLNSHGFGCDENATGLLRFTPNWRNGRLLLHKDEVTIRRVQRDNEPCNVLSRVYNEIRRAPLFKTATRTTEIKAGLRFAVKDAADKGLSRIYSHILDSEPESLTITTSFEALAGLSGLSIPTLRHHLPKASWLRLERVYGEGLCLTLLPTIELSERAYRSSPRQKAIQAGLSSAEAWNLPAPEFVGDGDRNNYLWRRAVLLRNEGLTLDDAISRIRGEARRIPGGGQSRNCRKLEIIVCSIFRHARQPQNTKRKIFPLEALTKSQSYSPLLGKPTGFVKSELSPREEIKFSNRRGTGDLPPCGSCRDEDVKVWLKSFLPSNVLEKRSEISETGVVLKIETFKRGPKSDENRVGNTKPFQTLKAARAALCRNLHPLDRLSRAIDRVIERSSEEEILSMLSKEHDKLCLTKDRGLKYKAPEGKFKRLCEAWSHVGYVLRTNFLVN